MRAPGKNASLVQRVSYFVASWLGPRTFAPFTGQDSRAFDAWCHLLNAWAVTDYPGRVHLEKSMGALLRVPQPHVLPAFKQAIAAVLDWSDIDPLWTLVDGPSDVGPVSYDEPLIECPTCIGACRIRDGETNDLRRCLDCGGSGQVRNTKRSKAS